MSYLTGSYIIFTLKMESESKNTIFGLKMIVKSGRKKIFLKFLNAGDYFFYFLLSKITNLVLEITIFSHGGISKLFAIIFRPKMVFLDSDSILRVKPMYESVSKTCYAIPVTILGKIFAVY